MQGQFETIIQDFEEFIINYKVKLDSFHPFLESAFLEMVKNGGKRFRPSLLLSIVFANKKEFIKNAYLPAFALECFHTYSLIHDDLPCMDNASLRRNHKTLHIEYDETSALLIGDGLNTFAFYLLSISKLSDKSKIEMIKGLSLNGGIHGMVLGQALDCYYEKEILALERLECIHLNKTAKLIATSLKMGAIISEIDFKDLIFDFGLSLGLYFQIRDDIIDKTKSTKEAGKSTNSDILKNSYVNLLGLYGAKNKLESIRRILHSQLDEIGKYSISSKGILLYVLKPYL